MLSKQPVIIGPSRDVLPLQMPEGPGSTFRGLEDLVEKGVIQKVGTTSVECITC